MRNRGLASQETPQEHMSIVRQKISFQHQEPIRKTNAFSTCFYTSFLSRDFPFCIDSLHTCSYSHLDFHTRHLFTEIAYQVTQVSREFDTRFLPFYTTCAIRCTCRKRTVCVCVCLKNKLRHASTTPLDILQWHLLFSRKLIQLEAPILT